MPDINTATEFALVPADTLTEASGDGQSVEVLRDGPRLFVLCLDITEQLEQQSLELSIYGSSDGQTWGAMPLLKFPQRFYRGSTQMVLDLSERPDVRFLRARWELNRWGRGLPRPRFRFGVTARPADTTRV